MELWKFECRKLGKNRLVCGLMFGCFFLNILLLFWKTDRYDADSMCFPREIKSVYEELSGIPEEKKAAWLNRRLEEADHEQSSLSAETDIPYGTKHALRYVSSHVEETNAYEKYLDGIEKQAGLIASSALFSEKDAFSRRNAALIPKKYRHLHGLALQAENPQGILLVTESKTTDLCLIVLILLLVYFFISMEREEGTMAFVQTAKYGGKTLGKTKIGLIFAGSLAGTLFLYAGNFLTAWAVYGFGEPGRCLQSVKGYLGSPWKISAGGYLVLFLLGKFAAAAVAAGVAVWILLHGKSILRISAALLCAIAVEYGLYTKIPPHSWLDLLRQCNLFSLFRTERFFQSYEMVNLFGIPVSSIAVSLIAGTFLLLITLILSICSYERVSRKSYGGRGFRKCFLKRRHGHSLFCYEGYKIFVVGGTAAVCVVYLFLQFISCSGGRVYFTLDELYYKNYIGKLKGAVTQEKLDFVESEGRRIDKVEAELLAAAENPDGFSERSGNAQVRLLSQQLSCQPAYGQILAQTKRIGPDGVFLDETGYGYLLEKDQQLRQLGTLLIVWVLAFYGVFVVEETSNMTALWNSIPYGRQKIKRRKRLFLVVCVIVLCAASDCIVTVYRMQAQNIDSLGVPIRYLPGFEGWGRISAGGYLAVLSAGKMMAGMCVCGVIEWISKRAKNAVSVLLAAGSAAGVLYLGIWLIVFVG